MLNNKIRIIGGKFSGRKIEFPDKPNLRPTPDRVRETLFNWLSPFIYQARCLELFAGSAALSFESASRGASFVCTIEKDPEIVAAIQKNKELLKIENMEIIQSDCMTWLRQNKTNMPKNMNAHFLDSRLGGNDNRGNDNQASETFDIVYIDPPYSNHLLHQCFQLLTTHAWLSRNAHIYFENNEPVSSIDLPENWTIIKEKKAGQVYFYLAEFECNKIL